MGLATAGPSKTFFSRRPRRLFVEGIRAGVADLKERLYGELRKRQLLINKSGLENPCHPVLILS
jgi:hypothetical protein